MTLAQRWDVWVLNLRLKWGHLLYRLTPKAPCGHPWSEIDDYGCGLCWHEAHMKRMGPRIHAWLATRTGGDTSHMREESSR